MKRAMNSESGQIREVRSFLASRDPSVDRMCRPRPKKQVNLFGSIYEENSECYLSDSENEELSSSPSTVSLSLQSEGALVYLRMKPVDTMSSNYKLLSNNVLVTSQQDNSLNGNNKNNMERHFKFTDVFEGSVDQYSVYETCIRNKIENEENFTVLTYGTSGSGKTFTLLGDLVSPGVIPRALENIFKIYAKNIFPDPAIKIINSVLTILEDDNIEKEKKARFNVLRKCKDIHASFKRVQESIKNEHDFQTVPEENKSIFIWISFVEIYNELVYDLLGSDPITLNSGFKRKNHKIVSNDGQVFIKDLTTIHVTSSEEAYKLLMLGLNKVKYASTAINSNSSRSHCIFSVDVIRFSHPNEFTQSSYQFCDLAGSERLHKTGNVGCRLKEAQRINTSLMILGRCLDAANGNQKKKNADVIPFRESKLTMLLQSALLGKEKLTMIVNITPTEQYFDENLNVLTFSSIAKNIVFKPTVQEKRTRYSWLASTQIHEVSLLPLNKDQLDEALNENLALRNEVETLKCEISRLESQLMQQEVDLRNKLVDDFQKSFKERNKSWESRLTQELATLEQMYKSKIKNLKTKHRLELEERDELNRSLPKENVWFKINSGKNQDEENCSKNILKKRRCSLG